MAFQAAPWHWLVFGMVLMMAEIFMPSFTVFWFGLGGITVAVFLWALPSMAFSWQLFIWTVASAVFTFLWFKFIKPMMMDRTTAGISREAVIGESGQVIRAPEEGRRGVVRFSAPLLGNDEWLFICDAAVMVGDRVFVKDVSGNALIVEKRQNS
jgi:membrane protein implicated in regulation of membrane protease activity